MDFKDETQRPLLVSKGDPLLLAVLHRINGFSEFLYETFKGIMGNRHIIVRHFSPEEPNKVQLELDGRHTYWTETMKKDLRKMNLQNNKVTFDHVNSTRNGHYFAIEVKVEE